MTRLLLCFLLVAPLLAGCAPDYRTDAEGYVLPQHCRVDALAATQQTPVFFVPRHLLEDRWTVAHMLAEGTGINGMYDPAFNPPVIWVADDLRGWRREDTLRHEQFHAYCQATRDPCCVGHFSFVQ